MQIAGPQSPPNPGSHSLNDENLTAGDAMTYMNMTNALYVGGRLKAEKRFCDPCLIKLSGCNTGNWRHADVATLLAKATGCSVITTGGYASGTFASGRPGTVARYRDFLDPEDREGTLFERLRRARRDFMRGYLYDSQNDTYYLTLP